MDDRAEAFVEQFARLSDADLQRLAMWTGALQGDQPESTRQWWSAISREVNSIGPHPAAVNYRRAIESVRRLLDEDIRSMDALHELVDRLNDTMAGQRSPIEFVWPGGRRALWVYRFGLVVVLGCIAFLAGAIGMGLGGRRDVMSVMALIAFGFAGLGFLWYLVDPLMAPTKVAGHAALSAAIAATAMRERLLPAEYETLIEPWRHAIDEVPWVEPPRRWRTAILGGRALVVAISGGATAILAIWTFSGLGR